MQGAGIDARREVVSAVASEAETGTMGQQQRRRKRPLGVTFLAILQVIAGIQSLGTFLFFLALSSWAKSPEGLADLAQSGAWLLKNASGLFFLLACVYLIFGVGSLLLARGYVKGFEWARRKGRLIAVLAIVLAVLGITLLPNIVAAGSPVWIIFSNIVLFAYLGSRKVRAYFS